MPNRSELLITSTIAILVTSYISFVLVALNAGFGPGFLMIWFRSWLIAFVMALPSLLYVGPFLRKVCQRFTSPQL